MKKLIAKTQDGTEFFHSKQNAFFASDNVQKIADILNKNKYNLKEGEHWHVYDYDFMQDGYVEQKIYISRNGKIKAAYV